MRRLGMIGGIERRSACDRRRSSAYGWNFKACCLSAESQSCCRKAPGHSAPATKASFWRQVDTPEFIPAWLIMDEAPIGHPLMPQMPPPLWLWLTCLWTHGRRCANTCTPEGGRWAALLHTGATVEGQVCSLIFFILDDMLSCSSGSRFKKKKKSQMDTSDLLEKISCQSLNKHEDKLLSWWFTGISLKLKKRKKKRNTRTETQVSNHNERDLFRLFLNSSITFPLRSSANFPKFQSFSLFIPSHPSDWATYRIRVSVGSEDILFNDLNAWFWNNKSFF